MSTSSTSIYSQNETIQRNKACVRKCWICLTVVELDRNEVIALRNLFLAKNLYKTNSKPENFVQLKRLFNRIILSACKCRKKLAHEACFNKYIDLKQSANVTIQLACQQCNLKYEFSYPYNGLFLQVCDSIDKFINTASSILAFGAILATTYWSLLSYGAVTILQIYGNESGSAILQNTSLVISYSMLPLIPVGLVLCRFIPWIDALKKVFCLKQKRINTEEKDGNGHNDDDDDDEVENSRLSKNIRLFIGGLALPTVAISLDRVISGAMGFEDSSIIRTTVVGLAFVFCKGISKIFYEQKKQWEKNNKSIQNYIT